MQRGRSSFWKLFVNDLDHPNDPAKCKEDGQFYNNFFCYFLDHPTDEMHRDWSSFWQFSFVNDLDHPNEPAKCKEGGSVSDNFFLQTIMINQMSQPNAKRTVKFLTIFFVNDRDHPNEPAKCKEDGQVSDNFSVMVGTIQMSRPNAKRMFKFLTTLL